MKKTSKLRTGLLWAAAARATLSLIAIPLAPFLYEKHFLVLVLLRPTKEVLLAGGFLARQQKVPLLLLAAAALPLLFVGVWHFYYLGRAYSNEMRSKNLPPIAQRLLPEEKISRLRRILRKKGPRLVILGRLAVFPSTLVGAAAGSSNMKTKEFLPADAIGGLLSLVEVIGAGFLLGIAYKEAGPWITVAGVLALGGMAFLLGWYLKRD